MCSPQQLPNFLGTHYGGMYCGVTVLTTLVLVQRYMLFYPIALPIAETLNYMGVPALFQYTDKEGQFIRCACVCDRRNTAGVRGVDGIRTDYPRVCWRQ
jgi:hypothetical protein